MATFGETLKRARELREISLRQVSEATKISIRYLEALEQNHFEVLPGGLFNKGFIRAYSTFIGVDPDAMVNSYLEEVAARADRAAGRVAPRSDGGLHRPADLPPRRSGAVAGGGDGRRPPTITFAPTAPVPAEIDPARRDPVAPSPAPESAVAHAPAIPAPAVDDGGARAASTAPAKPAAPVEPNRPPASDPEGPVPRFEPGPPVHAGPYATHRPPSVQRIVTPADAPPEQRPRVLLGILVLVAGAGLIFVLLGVLSGRGPGPGARSPSSPPSGTALPAATVTPPIGIAPGGEPTLPAPASPAGPAGAAGAAAPGAGAAVPLTPRTPATEVTGPATGAPVAPAGTGTPGPVPSPPPALRPADPKPRAKATPLTGIASIGGSPHPSPAESPAGYAPAGEAPGARGGAVMALEISTALPTFVSVECDGEVKVYATLPAGESRRVDCRNVIKVSAHDAGAVLLRVNDVDCLPLGAAGSRVYGYTIRNDDVERICRSGRERDDGGD